MTVRSMVTRLMSIVVVRYARSALMDSCALDLETAAAACAIARPEQTAHVWQ
jgi:hypothetical protein